MLIDIVLRGPKIWSKSFFLIHVYMGIIDAKSYFNVLNEFRNQNTSNLMTNHEAIVTTYNSYILIHCLLT